MTEIPNLPHNADNLTAALSYAEAGLYLLPVAPGTKNPGSRVGKTWQDKSSRDIEVLTAWFAGSSDGIAIDIGRSGLIVLDVDKPELIPAWLNEIILSVQPPYQSTRPDSIGRGHYLFTQPAGRRIGNGKGKLSGLGLDIRGAGGVICVQPTQHPESGEYRWVLIGEIPELPVPLSEMLADTAQAESCATDSDVRAFIQDASGSSRPGILANWTRKYRGHVERGDSRHDTMVSILTAALEEARAGYFPARDAIEILQEAFIESMLTAKVGVRSLSENSAYAEFRGMLAWAVAQARSTPLVDVRAKTEKGLGSDFSDIWTPPAIRLQVHPSDVPDGLLPRSDSPPITSVSPPIVNGHKRVHLTLANQIKSNVPTWAWSYDHRGRIQKGTLAILAGRPAAGKSNAARWFAAGYSNGNIDGCWYGQPVNVAYISPGEESHSYVIKPGLDAAGADTARICFPDMRDLDDNPTKLMSAAHRDWLIEAFVAASVRVIVVDPIMSTIPGTTNINQNNETRVHVEPWSQIAEAIDGIVLGVAHFTKFPGNDLVAAINGSSAFGEVARAIFAFVKDKRTGDRVMSQVKNSTGVEDLSLRYEIATATIPTDLGGEAQVAAFNILGRCELSAADVLDSNTEGETELGGPGFAMAWLRDYLEEQGKAPAKQICAKAKNDEDISRPTLYRAMKQLNVVSFREGYPCKAYWRLPTAADRYGENRESD
jgi:hypothetical protein